MSNSQGKLTLKETQKLMASCVFNPLTSDFNMSQRLLSGESIEEISRIIISPNDRLSAFDRLQIYNRQYWYRLTDCLYDDYPGMRAIIGNKQFYDLSCVYLTKYPSKNFSLSELGKHLCEFISHNPQWGGKRQNAFLEMARFEWAQVVAFDREFLPPLNLASLTGLDPSKIKFRLQPYITLLELNYPFDDFFIALKKNESSHSESVAQRDLSKSKLDGKLALPKKKRIWLAVHRLNNLLYYKRLEEPAFVLLSEIQKGRTVSQACEFLISDYFTKHPLIDLSDSVQRWFSEWAMLNWFVAPSDSGTNN